MHSQRKNESLFKGSWVGCMTIYCRWKNNDYNTEAMKTILNGLSKSNYDKVICCEIVKEICNKLHCSYDDNAHMALKVNKYS